MLNVGEVALVFLTEVTLGSKLTEVVKVTFENWGRHTF